jgi:hypothetical protein
VPDGGVSAAAAAPLISTLAGVLLLAGAGKLRHPAGAASALAAAGLPGGLVAVRLVAAGEIALGVVSLFVPGRAPVVLLVLVFAAFAAVAERMRRRGVADCGCFGGSEDGPGLLHVGLSAAAALVAAAAALGHPRGAAPLVAAPPAVAAATVGAVLAAVLAAQLAYTALPRAWSAWSGGA